MSNRETMVEQLKNTFEHFKERGTVGRIKTEHSVFIPTQLMREQPEEIKEFIIVARFIKNAPEFNCPVYAEEKKGMFPGVEFIFEFSPNTDFDSLIDYIESKI